MKKSIMFLILLPILCIADLIPDTMEFVWVRGETNAPLAGTYLADNTYLLTNNVVTNQDLTGLQIQIRTGSVQSNRVFIGTMYADGRTSNFWALVTIPTPRSNGEGTSTAKIQLSLTNGVSSVTYGGSKLVTIQNKLE